MRLFFIFFCLLGAMLTVVQRISSQGVGDQIRCWTCPGNEADHKDCCAKAKMCCDGRVKFVGNFPKPSTTAWGR